MVSTMPVFRVEKNSNYTTMCNYHLRDQGLSLKGKGLLSMKYYGVTEQLKAENQIEWVRQMNACVAQAEETIKGELIYCE